MIANINNIKIFYPSISSGNMDPLINILGDRFATVQGPDSASQRFVEEIIKTKAETEEETASLEEKKCEMNIMFKIKELDSRLLLEHITLGKERYFCKFL